MKLIFTLAVLAVLGACQDDPPVAHPFVGSWHYQNNQVPIEIRFDVVSQGGGILDYRNRQIIHPAIPLSEQSNNNLRVYDEFKDSGGYGKIEITSRGPVNYAVVLIYNRFTSEGMMVYDVQLDIPSEPFIVIPDQMFTRK